MGAGTIELRPGCLYVPGYLDREAQEALVADLMRVVEAAPFFTPRMPRTGKPFSVRMTNCGALGWVSDAAGGYRYQAMHPETGAPWPPMPALALRAWRDLAPEAAIAEACLVNHYLLDARMGLHRDEDEEDVSAPVVSLSLGDTAVFRIGGTSRKDATRSIKLQSGDAVVLGGESRLAFHGVDRIIAGSSTLLSGWPPGGGRLNLTLRRVRRTGSGEFR